MELPQSCTESSWISAKAYCSCQQSGKEHRSGLVHLSFWSKSFHAFPDKLLWELASSFMDTFIMRLSRPDELLVMLHWIPSISWPLIGRVVFRQTIYHIDFNLGGNICYGTSHAWLHLGCIHLNSHYFLAFYWSVSLCTFWANHSQYWLQTMLVHSEQVR